MADPVTAVPATAPVPSNVDASKPGEVTKEQVSTAPKEKTYIINGKEWPESQLAQRIQKAEGLEKRVADADRYEKAFANLDAKMNDPEQFVALLDSPEFKYDEDKQASLVRTMLTSKKPKLIAAVKQWLYENEVEPATMTEEQRKAREDRIARAEAEGKLKKIDDENKTAVQRAEQQRIWNDYRIKIGSGIKTEGLPETEGMVVRVARKAMLMRRAGQPADIPNAVKAVKQELQAEYLLNMDKASDDEILNLLPENVLKKINAAYIKKLKAANPEPAKPELKEQSPFKRATKEEASSKENKEFWKKVGRGVYA